jgi:uncharacterized membrane protein YwaF
MRDGAEVVDLGPWPIYDLDLRLISGLEFDFWYLIFSDARIGVGYNRASFV